MAEVLYPYGYGGAMLPLAEIEAKTTVRNAHKEFWRRYKAMMVAGAGRLGIGTMWRSSDVQRTTFLDRHYRVTSGGCCYYEGARYQLKKGVAHAAPPGRSFHESTFHGYAQACDAIGDLTWMHTVEKDYGLKDFRNVGNEPWHVQMYEIPNSVTSWINAGRPQPQVWDLPGGPDLPVPPEPVPPDVPMPATPTTGAALEMYLVMKYGGTAESGWSGYYSDGNKRYGINQASGGLDHCARLVRSGAKDAKTNAVVTSMTWVGVSHTTSSTELTKFLGPA